MVRCFGDEDKLRRWFKPLVQATFLGRMACLRLLDPNQCCSVKRLGLVCWGAKRTSLSSFVYILAPKLAILSESVENPDKSCWGLTPLPPFKHIGVWKRIYSPAFPTPHIPTVYVLHVVYVVHFLGLSEVKHSQRLRPKRLSIQHLKRCYESLQLFDT
jgi:hypothetical protein